MLTLPDFVHPIARKVAGLPGRLIPYAIQRPVLALALNEAFREPMRQGELDFLQGARIRIKVTDLCIDWLIRINAERLSAIERKGQDDVCISGESFDFLLLATRQADPDTLFFQRRIRIEGDTELGLGLKNTMDSMDWEDLPMPLRKLLRLVSILIERLQAQGEQTKQSPLKQSVHMPPCTVPAHAPAPDRTGTGGPGG